MRNLSTGVRHIPKLINDSLAQPIPDSRIPREIEEARAQQTSRGITPRKQDIQHLVAQDLGVIRFRRESFGEDIPIPGLLLGVSFLGFQS